MTRALIWLRRDLRLADNPALHSALASGLQPVLVYIDDSGAEGAWAVGAASSAWLDRSLRALSAEVSALGSALVVCRGEPAAVLRDLAGRCDAGSVHWNRLYEPAAIARDRRLKQNLRETGLEVRSFNASLLVEPWEVEAGAGGPYRVFTPFWRKVQTLPGVRQPLAAPQRLEALPGSIPQQWQGTAAIEALQRAPSRPWDREFWQRFSPGAIGAGEMLDAFVEGALADYPEQRDLPDRTGTSRLSPHLHFGEISPLQILERLDAERARGAPAAPIDSYRRQLGWREFAHHLLFHFPGSADADLNPGFASFRWNPPQADVLEAWKQGRTGVPIVDAGMRELWRTGWMHNRVRMIVASYLTKNLRIHWRHGAQWFWDTLVDADLANNSLGWQWVAGTGADAAPYFRIFNPVTQAQKFDPHGRYIRRWCPELPRMPLAALFAPWEHPQLRRTHAPDWPEHPLVELRASREAALAAYRGR